MQTFRLFLIAFVTQLLSSPPRSISGRGIDEG
jgi:hypothetical protein